MEIIFVRRCKKSKQNSAKIIHRNSALISIFPILYAIIVIEHVFPCFNIRWVPRAMLKTSGCALGFQHLPRNPADVNARKNMFDPYIKAKSSRSLSHWLPYWIQSELVNFMICHLHVICISNMYMSYRHKSRLDDTKFPVDFGNFKNIELWKFEQF